MVKKHAQSDKPVKPTPRPSPNFHGWEQSTDTNPTSQDTKKSPLSALGGDLEGGQATKEFARQMRNPPTPAEKILWQRLRKRQVHHVKFRRQHTINQFIVDFFAAEERLIIEVDGVIHEYQLTEDINRQQHLEALCLIVLRFTNDEVIKSIDAVIERIGEIVLEIQSKE